MKHRHLLPIYRLLGLTRNEGAKPAIPPVAPDGALEMGANVSSNAELDAHVDALNRTGQNPETTSGSRPSSGQREPFCQARSERTNLEQRSPIFYHRPHGEPRHGITAEVIEDFNKLCVEVVDNPGGIRFAKPDDLTLITCNNYSRSVLIERCYQAYGITDYVVLGKDVVEWDWSAKVRPVLDFLQSGKCLSHFVIATDSDDILMVNDPVNIISLFENYSCDVLFCNTFLNWPAKREYGEFESLKYYTHQFHSHLSAGGYIGRRDALIEFLKEIMEAFEEKKQWAMDGRVFNDQLAWKHLHYKYYPRIKVDFESLIFKRYDLFMDYD
jgi:hypothetical protein